MKFAWLGLLLLLLGACSNSERPLSQDGADTVVEEDSLAGMILVKATDEVVVLGTDEASAKVNERPQMRVRFGYDFSLARHEVTCGEFDSLMERSTGLSLNCADAQIPATHVTYYDAVLFANERSKAEGFDTAYTYVSAIFDSDRHCTNLEGFAYHPDVEAFRLPTEAEWVLVASMDWNPENSWNAENSDYKLHKVCGKNVANEFCDLAGNAMEWVNDWLGEFHDTEVLNFVGAPDGGSLGQRVVKGGSYRNLAESMTLYSRGDVYTVTSSTRADYVGFRLAFGAVPHATWLGNDGQSLESRIVPLASSTTLHALSGTYKMKLVFRNDLTGNLAVIDYSGATLSVVEMDDGIDAYHPDISPDGSKVAFCTGLEGVSGQSTVYVRSLEGKEKNLVKLNVESAAIPRWRVLENGDTVIVYVTDAGDNTEDADFRKKSTWQVPFKKGKFGKPQKLFDGAYHGGISEDNTLAVSGSKLLRARVAKMHSSVTEKAEDFVWYNRLQACNVSLAKDSSKRTLFLDFGGATGQNFAGEKYGTHKRLLVADASGELIQSVGAPAGNSFDHSEWVIGSENLVVASLANVNGAHQKMVLINLKDSSLIDLAEGEELWHPCLWFKKTETAEKETSLLDLDSAGIYFVSGQDWMHEALGFKMTMLWKYKDDVEILCVGSSRVEDGIAVTQMTSGFALNMGHPGNELNASLYVAENYGVNHLSKLKAVVVSLDLDLWQTTVEYTDEHFRNAPGYVYDANHFFWKEELPKDFVNAVDAAANYSASKMAYEASRGFSANGEVEWGLPLVESDSNWTDERTEQIPWNLARLDDFLGRMDSLNIRVVGVIFPQNPRYQETGAWGRYGPRRSVAAEVLDSLKKMQKHHRVFTLMDENKNGKHDYSDEMALNTDHLSALGAAQITQRLDSLLKTLER